MTLSSVLDGSTGMILTRSVAHRTLDEYLHGHQQELGGSERPVGRATFASALTSQPFRSPLGFMWK